MRRTLIPETMDKDTYELYEYIGLTEKLFFIKSYSSLSAARAAGKRLGINYRIWKISGGQPVTMYLN